MFRSRLVSLTIGMALFGVVHSPVLGQEGNDPLPTSGQGSEHPLPPKAGRNFIIVPFTTELQRDWRWTYTNARFLVVINGRALLKSRDTVLDTSALDYEGLWETLRSYPHANMQDRSIIVRVVGVPAPKHQTANWGASVVFRRFFESMSPWIAVDFERRNYDWRKLVEELTALPEVDATAGEAGVGDELVRVYAVRTPLARHFLRDVANCAILIGKPFDEFTSDELQTFAQRVKNYVAQLHLEEPARAYFIGRYGNAKSEANLAANRLTQELTGVGVQVTALTAWHIGMAVRN